MSSSAGLDSCGWIWSNPEGQPRAEEGPAAPSRAGLVAPFLVPLCSGARDSC